ncbi:MAG TPA: hypothetical protein VHR66_25300 [Gemmataceae bacterium]|nr:hypothetical protein [Gemmataceae bacterium]
MIPIEIIAGKEVIRYEVLVDSGADCNIVPAELGDLLGLDVPAGVENPVGGITGGGKSFFVHPATIRVGGWSYDAAMGFMPDMPPFGYGVVGQRGFFDLFKVTFDHRKTEIELHPY